MSSLPEGTRPAGDGEPKKSGKKKGKSAAARGPGALGKSRGTGFEDFYCDPPMTPAESQEEHTDIYALHRPVVDRIEQCIQRFRARRRLDSDRANFFNKYLALGGIDPSPRQFQGGDTLDLDDATPVEVREAMASDVIHRTGSDSRFYNPSSPEHWDVDFAGVAAGFFSERIFNLTGSDLHLVGIAVAVVQNFLNYVLYHDVCPEYADNIKQAKVICEQALDQILRIFTVWKDTPGEFSRAVQALYCEADDEQSAIHLHCADYQPMSLSRAAVVFMATVATKDAELVGAVARAHETNDIRVEDTIEQWVEIIELREPSKETLRLYRGVKDVESGALGGTIDPCGMAVVQPVAIKNGWDTGQSALVARGTGPCEELVIDCKVMRHLVVGMKMHLVVCRLSVGMSFIKAFKGFYPSYYTFLPQELMLGYKEPVPNERPAPSAEDLEAEEMQLARVD